MLLGLCHKWNEEFDFESYCKSWKAGEYIIFTNGSGMHLPMKCKWCKFMPKFSKIQGWNIGDPE